MYLKGPYYGAPRRKKLHWLFLVMLGSVTLTLFFKGCTTKAQGQKSAPEKKPLSERVVVIDPGHGGSDPGACRADVLEKDINLAIAQRMAKHLPSYRVKLTRQQDGDFVPGGAYTKEAEREDLTRRIKISRAAKGEVFVSIHVNTGEGQDRGALVYYPPTSSDSTRLAQLVQKEVNGLPGASRKKARPDQFYLFENLQIPVILVETGWLCSPEERARLQDPAYQDQMAAAISRGIHRFMQEKNK